MNGFASFAEREAGARTFSFSGSYIALPKRTPPDSVPKIARTRATSRAAMKFR